MNSIEVLNLLKNYLDSRKKLKQAKSNWRNMNLHNHTTVCDIFPQEVVEVGNGTYGNIDVKWFCDKHEHLTIGHFCSIAMNTMFLTGGNHYLDTLSSFPFDTYYNTGKSHLSPTKGPIVIGDDVWIGINSIILSGVTIGQGAVVAAGSVVAKDIPPYAIFAGGKIVKYRFDNDTINKLLKFDYSKLTEEDIVENRDLLYSKIDDNFFESEFYKTHLK